MTNVGVWGVVSACVYVAGVYVGGRSSRGSPSGRVWGGGGTKQRADGINAAAWRCPMQPWQRPARRHGSVSRLPSLPHTLKQG